ncbi:MAG: NAD(P)H-hydrate dehydratase [Dissulfuribacterales bacterium]
MILLTAQEMQAVDAFAIEQMGIPGRLLMENAGRLVAEAIFKDFAQAVRQGVLLVCGPGNNGGDGFVTARYLFQAGVRVQILCLCTKDAYKGDSLANLQLLKDIPVHFCISETELSALHQMLQNCGLVVDAIFGTGLKREVTGLFAKIISTINAAKIPVVAVDIPSGLSTDSGTPLGIVVRADLTVTMQYFKLGHFLAQGPEFCGKFQVVDIGIPQKALEAISPKHSLTTIETARNLLKHRSRTGHKGSFGHVLILAGSHGKYGAGLLACRGALRAGAGLVTLACSSDMQRVLAQSLSEAMSILLKEDMELEQGWQVVIEATKGKKAVGLGPGFGLSFHRIRLMLKVIEELETPVVVDADALSALAQDLTHLSRAREVRILTPHPGEMSRLTGLSISDVQADRVGVTRDFAQKYSCYIVLKGAGTVIAAPDGRVSINSTGNPGMGAAGMGDVLTGIIAGLLAQGYGPWEASLLGVFAHGMAGNRLSEKNGPFGFFASELADELPQIWKALLKKDMRV